LFLEKIKITKNYRNVGRYLIQQLSKNELAISHNFQLVE